MDVGSRLDELRDLQDGWLDGEGVAPDHAGLDWLSGAFKRHYPDDLQLPHTYPTEEGGISLEWSFGTWNIDIEVDLEKHTGEWYAFDKDAKNCEEEKKLELDRPGDWKWVGERIRAIMDSPDTAVLPIPKRKTTKG